MIRLIPCLILVASVAILIVSADYLPKEIGELPPEKVPDGLEDPLGLLWYYFTKMMDWLGTHQWAVHLPVIAMLSYQRFWLKNVDKTVFNYEPEEIAEVRLKLGTDLWERCRIIGRNAKDQSKFDIEVLVGPDSHEDAKQFEGKTPAVTPGSLRKLVPKDESSNESEKENSKNEESKKDD